MNFWHFTSEDNSFSLVLPENWSKYEDDDNVSAFFNTEEWSGNLRITLIPLEGKFDQVRNLIQSEINDNPNAILTKIGQWDAAFYSQEVSNDCLVYFWSIGIINNLVVCSLTIDKSMLASNKHTNELKIVEKILSSIKIID